jgi:hypothetical protein
MNTTITILGIAFIAVMCMIEGYFKPRIDFTSNNDVVLWYYNRKRERLFILLFHIHN